MARSPLISLSFLIAVAYATNDWSKPCFQGECSYDLPKAKGSQSATGTIRIWGSENAIADVTSAGGWEIIGCSPSATSQDIRLVCKSDDAESACNHLYENGGAVNKIVRLPQNCGANAFARISRAWDPEDQALPTEVAAKIVRRGGIPPQVKALSLDTDFAAVDPSKNGPVNIVIQGMNAPGYENKLATVPVVRQRNRRRHSARSMKRGLFDIIGDAIDIVGDAIESFNEFDIEKSTQLPPIEINEPFNLVDETIDCGAVKASLKIDVDAKARAVVDIGVVATGTLVPPKLDNFNVFTGLSADLNGTLSLVADAIGELSTGEITIFEIGIPGLDFPGILQVGPSFKINALAKATLDVKLDMEVGLNYQIKNARLVFPPNDKQKNDGAFGVADTPLKLSVSPSVEAKGTLEAHLIPQVDIGLEAFSVVEATVFVNLDAAAILELTLKAGVNVGVGVGGGEASASASASSMKELPSSTVMVKHPMATPSSSPMMHETSQVGNTGAHSTKEAMPAKETNSSIQEAITPMKEVPMPTKEASMPAEEQTQPMKHLPVWVSVKEVPVPMNHEPSPMMPRRSFPRRHLAVLDVRTPASKASTPRQPTVSTDVDTFFGGCIALKTGLSVNAGANANFLGLFDQGTAIELFKREFELFKRCFGDSKATDTPKRSILPPRTLAMSSRQLGGLICAAPEIKNAVNVADQDVKAVDIKAV